MPPTQESIRTSLLFRCATSLRRFIVGVGAAGAIVFAESPAEAQPTANDKALAEGLFDAGKKLLEAGQFREACDKFEASQKLDAGIGTLLYLADCYERAGRTASAWATFREAAAAAKSAADAPREKIARARAEALDPKLSRITVILQKSVPGLVVRRDGEVMPSGSYSEANPGGTVGVALPIDPGTHVFELSAPGYDTVKKTVEIASDRVSSEVVMLPELQKSPVPVETPTNAVAPIAPTPVLPPLAVNPATDAEEGLSSMFIAGTVIGSVGVAGLVVTGVLASVAKSKDSDADEVCTETSCPTTEATELSADARTLGDVATGTFIGGIGLTASGVLLMLLAPSPGDGKTNAKGGFIVRPARRGLGIEGTF